MGRQFWLRHAVLPGTAFLLVAWAGAFTTLDQDLARAWAWDAVANRFVGANTWWARELIHAAGGMAIRAAGVALLLVWLLARYRPAWSAWRRACGYAVVAAASGALLVGLLKATSNVDCPRALAGFGGTRPYVHLFGDRPDDLPRARCFPGGHSSSGFALFAFYFALRDRHRRAARVALLTALAVGGLFAFGQEARGEHFLSHDAWSAAIGWFASLWVYAALYRGRIWPGPDGGTTPTTIAG